MVLRIAVLLCLLVFQTSCATTKSHPEAWATVRVTSGDTLRAIASAYKISVQELVDANDIDTSKPIYVGQILAIPLTSEYLRSRLAVRDVEPPGRLIWPLHGRVSSHFGRRGWREHEGIDISAPRNTRIHAAHDGVVVFSGWMRGYGQTVIVEHKNFRTLYAHCNRVNRRKGDRVERGEVIASVGKTGNARGYHLHFEYRTAEGKALNPLDYLPTGPALLSKR